MQCDLRRIGRTNKAILKILNWKPELGGIRRATQEAGECHNTAHFHGRPRGQNRHSVTEQSSQCH